MFNKTHWRFSESQSGNTFVKTHIHNFHSPVKLSHSINTKVGEFQLEENRQEFSSFNLL